jgi:hypothetical protein
MRSPGSIFPPRRAGGPGARRASGALRRRGLAQFNRVSFWVRPECPGYYGDLARAPPLQRGFREASALFGQKAKRVASADHDWNRVVREIGNVPGTRWRASRFSSSFQRAGGDEDLFSISTASSQKSNRTTSKDGPLAWAHRLLIAGYRPAEKSAGRERSRVWEFWLVDQATGQLS